MSVRLLDFLFAPKSIALVGASPREGTVGSTILTNLLSAGFPGPVYPVNPKYGEIAGIKCHPSLLSIGAEVELAVVAVPIAAAVSVIEECARAKVKAAIVISAGGREAGGEGAKIEAEILKAAQKGPVRILGPNCLGAIVPGSGLNATFASHGLREGKVAIVSQSGAVLTIMLDRAASSNIGFSHFISIGSMADVDFGDIIDYLGSRPEVDSILLYVEALTNIRKFMSAARAVSRQKPIIVVKAGRSAAGASAAASHTGSLVGDDEIYDAAFARAGVVRVKTLGELFDCAEALSKQGRGRGPRIAILTNAGGPGVMCADAMGDWNRYPARLKPETIESLDRVLPTSWSRQNPVDILGDATPERYREALKILLNADEVDGIIIMLTPQAMTEPALVAGEVSGMLEGMRATVEGGHTPVCAVWMGGADISEGIRVLNEKKIPVFETPERAVGALFHMFEYTKNQELLHQTPPSLPQSLSLDAPRAKAVISSALERNRLTLTEPEAKALLSAYGIPVNATEIALTSGEAARRADEIGYPVALKIHSPDITHKSDVGGIRLSLKNPSEVEGGWTEIMKNVSERAPKARVLGVTVQPMSGQAGHEVILGIKQDPSFGPVILFGMGGVLTEIYRDKSIGLPPMNMLLARRMIESTRFFPVLKGFRGAPTANLDLLEEALVRLSYLASDFPQIAELDINPLILSGEKILAVDARVMLRRARVKSPDHLVILPYPSHYESHWVTGAGTALMLRPVRPEDEPKVKEFFSALSARTIFFRFFHLVKTAGHDLLSRLCQVDYDREISLIAVEEPPGGERVMGMCRLRIQPGSDEAELAVVIGDRWQRQGLGRKMISAGLKIARQKGISRVTGAILPENHAMLKLAKKLSFTALEDLGEGVWKIEKVLG